MKTLLAIGLGAFFLAGSTSAFACDGQGADTTNTSTQPKAPTQSKKDSKKDSKSSDKKDAAPTRS